MSRITRIALVGFLALSALFVVPGPASAGETGAVNFTGTATVGSPGLSYPPPGTTSATSGPTRTFNFGSSTCVSASNGKKGAQADDGCGISASGSVTGYCGLSIGSASGTITANNQSYSVSLTWTTSAGGTLVITGTVRKTSTGQTGTVAGEVTAVPTVGSCVSGTATGFTIVGDVAYTI